MLLGIALVGPMKTMTSIETYELHVLVRYTCHAKASKHARMHTIGQSHNILHGRILGA